MRWIPLPAKAGIVWVAVYLALKFFVRPPLPASVIFMYISLVTVGVLLYLTVFQDDTEAFFGPIKGFIMGSPEETASRKWSRGAVFALIPAFFGYQSYKGVAPSFEPPLEQRVVHPAPPTEFVGLYNPYREEKEQFADHVRKGGEIYFRNCVFCHGDKLDGNGIFADGFNLRPANFQDVGTIAMLQESFLFWRVSKGGIGLPEESTPWSSAMPRWEAILPEQDRWKVILFLYDYTGHAPRTWE